MQIIALTGGIASGKSTVSARLAEHGAVVVDADKLAREVVEPGRPALAQIAAEFGDGVLLPDGSLNRPALGAIVFNDEAARLKLNAITHPAVWKRGNELFAATEAENPDAIVVYDVPLLVEASADRPMHFEKVIVVSASRDERIRRLVADRGMSQAEAEARVGSQATDAERLAVADVVLDNDGTREELLAAVDELWATLSA
ncbi:dephospho-CoA kinase [Gryllotalpicola protaetiae]|uniref:Dephospho-CoA kinase n=1 Tax=Gryllotalpicola protaetiae TaxID=2419771 RepID=A0A387BXB0_9MICO|nr:dephospho-CoA kinase [Gryllotalpicola protaetiae]AYG05487.1 dephospho-CoA kinase [Gryllotalpicola protaetiae]